MTTLRRHGLRRAYGPEWTKEDARGAARTSYIGGYTGFYIAVTFGYIAPPTPVNGRVTSEVTSRLHRITSRRDYRDEGGYIAVTPTVTFGAPPLRGESRPKFLRGSKK